MLDMLLKPPVGLSLFAICTLEQIIAYNILQIHIFWILNYPTLI